MAEGAKLLSKVLDKVDAVLFEHGLEFKDEAKWEDFAAQLVALLYNYYDDEGDDKDDSDFDPDAPEEESSTDPDGSESLDDSAPAVDKKRKHA